MARLDVYVTNDKIRYTRVLHTARNCSGEQYFVSAIGGGITASSSVSVNVSDEEPFAFVGDDVVFLPTACVGEVSVSVIVGVRCAGNETCGCRGTSGNATTPSCAVA